MPDLFGAPGLYSRHRLVLEVYGIWSPSKKISKDGGKLALPSDAIYTVVVIVGIKFYGLWVDSDIYRYFNFKKLKLKCFTSHRLTDGLLFKRGLDFVD